MTKPKQWNERFALIDAFKPTDEQITKAFSINQAELDTARQLRKAGTIVAAKDLDLEAYGNPFLETSTDTVTSTKKGTKVTLKTSISTTDETSLPPESATQRVTSPRKRGRKGTKISEAFRAIPETPVSVETFAKQYNISVPVLRQSKRFDTAADLGVVRVKVNKDSGVLEIWRERGSAQ